MADSAAATYRVRYHPERIRKARRAARCPLCAADIRIGQREAYVRLGRGRAWVHLLPCCLERS